MGREYTAQERVTMQLFNHCHKNNNPITNLKYQKLLYYLHGWAMVLEKINYFERDAFQAWTHGPVHVEQYHQYKDCKSQPIIANFPEFKEEDFLVSLIVDHYGKLKESELVKMTHREPPWLLNSKKKRNRPLPDEEINEYFSSKEVFEEPIHFDFFEGYLYRKDSVPSEQVLDFSVGKVPKEEWAEIEREFGILNEKK